MTTNNMSNQENNLNKEDPIFIEEKASIEVVKKLIDELEEQVYSIVMQLKAQNLLLTDKETDFSEKERIKVHNLDLFSPIYNKTYDSNNLAKEIIEKKQKIEELNNSKKQLDKRIAALKNTIKSAEIISINTLSKNIGSKKSGYLKLGDKGLSILEAQEIERQRIARDLHDTTVQNLTSLVHKSELCIKLMDIDKIRAKLELTTMSNTIKTVINDMRGIIYNLKPMSLDDLGLTVTVERYINRLIDMSNVKVILNTNVEAVNILPVIKLTLFRIIQEACNNVIKHANASLIKIDICYKEDSVTVSIKDDGIGFDVKKMYYDTVEHSNSFGLSIMRERITLLSGTLDIKSNDQMGTTVIVSVPLSIDEGDKDD